LLYAADLKGLDIMVVECGMPHATGPHEFPGMLGYTHKEQHQPYFRSYLKNVTNEAR
jgi:hypothetical protein